MPAPVAVLVEVDGEPVFQAYIAYCATVHPHSYPPAAGVDHPRRHPPLFSITVFCELPSAHPARFYLFSPIYSLMIGRLMTFLGLGLLATIVPPNEPKCVLGIILSRPSGVERPPPGNHESIARLWSGCEVLLAR